MRILSLLPSRQVPKCDFSPQDISEIKEAILPYEYGKYSFVKNPQSFSLECSKDTYTLHNFEGEIDSPQGICTELAYKASKKLNKMFKDRFIFFEFLSFYKPYAMFHMALHGVRADKVNQIKELINRSKEFDRLAKEVAQKPISDAKKEALYDKYLRKMHLRAKDIQGGLILDPSFKVVASVHDKKVTRDYSPIALVLRKSYNPYGTAPDTVYPYSTAIPIGFADKLAPECNFDSETMVYLNFCKGEDKPFVNLRLQRKNKKDDDPFDYEALTNRDNPLRAFMDKVKADMSRLTE